MARTHVARSRMDRAGDRFVFGIVVGEPPCRFEQRHLTPWAHMEPTLSNAVAPPWIDRVLIFPSEGNRGGTSRPVIREQATILPRHFPAERSYFVLKLAASDTPRLAPSDESEPRRAGADRSVPFQSAAKPVGESGAPCLADASIHECGWQIPPHRLAPFHVGKGVAQSPGETETGGQGQALPVSKRSETSTGRHHFQHRIHDLGLQRLREGSPG